MKKFFNIPYDDDNNKDLYEKIETFNTLLDKLSTMYNLSMNSRAKLTQLFIDGMPLEEIETYASTIKQEKQEIDNDTMDHDEENNLCSRLAIKYHISIEKAKMVAKLLKLGIPYDVILQETDKIKDPPTMKKDEREM